LRISHVSRDGKSLDLLLFKFMADLIGELGAHVGNRNFGARLSQGDRKRFANALSGSGYQGHATIQPETLQN
jgi:hypothetical protein